MCLFAYVCLVFLRAGGVVCNRFGLGCCCSCPFFSVCFLLFICVLALVSIVCCLAVSSQSYLWGVSCDEPSGNKQMAHSQIVVVIVFSLTFEIYVACASTVSGL